MELKLVADNDPILKKECDVFDFSNPPVDPIELAKDMVKFLYDNNSLGLSANQVGLPYRVFCMRGVPENFVCYNPRIVTFSEDQVLLEENCLTYNGLCVKIKRPQHVRVRFTLPNGETMTKQFTGMTARVFQHEMEHMDGKIFYHSANLVHREQALRRWKLGKKFEMNVTPNEHILHRP